MSAYWVHVNHPTSKARIHVEEGCRWVQKAVERVEAGEPYGPTHGNINGGWQGPFVTLSEALIWQQGTGKQTQDYCRLGACAVHFTAIGSPEP